MGDRDLRLHVPTGEWRLLDFEAIEPIAERGYETSLETLRDWWVKEGATIP